MALFVRVMKYILHYFPAELPKKSMPKKPKK